MNARQPVAVDRADLEKMRNLSKDTGIPISVMMRRAIAAWLDANESKLRKALGEAK